LPVGFDVARAARAAVVGLAGGFVGVGECHDVDKGLVSTMK
jgi:hypothetical protein